MAWDDAPPSPDELNTKGSWDSAAPTADELKPPNSMIESAIHGVVNNIPLGPQIASGIDTLVGPKSYSENLANYNSTFKQAKKEHPIAYGVGAVGGALAPLAIPGVGEALEASPIAGNAALGAASSISNTDLLKNPTDALKQGTEGALLGGTVGGIMNKIMPGGDALENLADRKATESIGLPTKYLSDMSKDEYEQLGPYIRSLGLVGTDKESLLQNALEKQGQAGSRISEIGDQLTGNGIKATDDDILKAVEGLQSKAAETANLENPDLRKMSLWHNKGANDILNKISDDPSWQSIQNLKQAYGKAAFSDTGEVKNEASKNVYFTLRDMLQNLTKRAQDNPNLPSEYKEALLNYHHIDPIVEGLSGFVGRERAGVSGHGLGHGFLAKIIRSLPGQSNPGINLATAAGMTAVAPHLGPIMALPTLTNPAVQSNFFSGVASKLPGIQQGATQEVTDFLTSRFNKPKNYMEK